MGLFHIYFLFFGLRLSTSLNSINFLVIIIRRLRGYFLDNERLLGWHVLQNEGCFRLIGDILRICHFSFGVLLQLLSSLALDVPLFLLLRQFYHNLRGIQEVSNVLFEPEDVVVEDLSCHAVRSLIVLKRQ